MLYAILAYHVEAEVMSWTAEEDASVMTGLKQVHGRLAAKRSGNTIVRTRLEPATKLARLMGRTQEPAHRAWRAS